jgi:hypothetical protein
MKLKDKVIIYLTIEGIPKTIAQVAVNVAADIEVQQHYSKYAGKQLVDVIKNTIASTVKNWEGFVCEKIDGKNHINYTLNSPERVTFLYDGGIHTAMVIKHRGAFIDVMLKSGILKSIRKDTVL